MVTPKCHPHYRVRLEGSLGAIAPTDGFYETFSMGYNLIAFTTANADTVDGTCPLLPDELTYAADQAVNGWASALLKNAGVSQQAYLLSCKINRIGEDGHYTEDAANTYYAPAINNDVRGLGTTNVPLQLALAISTHTAKTRGKGAKGRTYVPTPELTLDRNGELDTTSQGQWQARAVQAYESAGINANGHFYRPAIVPFLPPGVGGTIPGNTFTGDDWGFLHPHKIVNVRVGIAPDTMRSRRKGLPENYGIGGALLYP